MAALMAMFEMGVATDDLDKLDPQSGSAQRSVLSSASGSEALPVTRRPVPLVTQFARPPSSLSYELAALFDEDPWSI